MKRRNHIAIALVAVLMIFNTSTSFASEKTVSDEGTVTVVESESPDKNIDAADEEDETGNDNESDYEVDSEGDPGSGQGNAPVVIKIPKAPESFKASLYGHDDVKLSWSEADGATGYYIYYKKSSQSKYTYLADVKTLSFSKANLEDNVKYIFKIVSYCKDGESVRSDPAQSKTVSIQTKKNVKAPSKVSTSLYGHDDVKVTWTKVSGAVGYYVYYKRSSQSKYTYLTSTKKLEIKRSNLADGTKYIFKIVPYYKSKDKNVASYYNKTAAISTLKKVPLQIKRSGLEKITLSWSNIAGETGYQISQSADKSKTKVVYTYKTTTASKKSVSLKLGKSYYYKIRPYKVAGKKVIYGPWSNVIKYKMSRNYYPEATLVKQNTEFLDLRVLAGQALYGYDIFQGSCTDGTYGYYILYNKAVEKCRIVKLRLKDNKVVKVSEELNIHHGNDLAYNDDTKKILAIHYTEVPEQVAIINPSTLKVEYNKKIKIPSKLSGATKTKLKKISGYTGITYNTEKNQYVLRIKSSGNFLITDKNLKPVKYITPKDKKIKERVYQGLDVINGYIACQQASSNTGTFDRYNILKLYTWSGEYAGTVNIRKGYELEGSFCTKGYGYAGFYHEYYVEDKMMRNNYIYKYPM